MLRKLRFMFSSRLSPSFDSHADMFSSNQQFLDASLPSKVVDVISKRLVDCPAFSQWHPHKNKNLNPSQLARGNKTKVWWQCSKLHEWQARINDRCRIYKASGCPHCFSNGHKKYSRKLLSDHLVAAQWHPTKNEVMKIEDFCQSAQESVWWQCEKGHEWKGKIVNRCRPGKDGCPICSKLKRAKKAGKNSELNTLDHMEPYFSSSIAQKMPSDSELFGAIYCFTSPQFTLSGQTDEDLATLEREVFSKSVGTLADWTEELLFLLPPPNDLEGQL